MSSNTVSTHSQGNVYSSFSTMAERPIRSHKPLLKDNIHGITSSNIRRLALKASIARVNAEVYDEIRDVIHKYVDGVIRHSITYMEHARRRTLYESDVVSAVFIATGTKTYDCGGNVRNAKISKKKSVRCQISEYQKQSECVYISRAIFKRVIREVAQDYHEDMRFSSDAIDVLQLNTEMYILKLFSMCAELLLYSGHNTLSNKEIKLARRLSSQIE